MRQSYKDPPHKILEVCNQLTVTEHLLGTALSYAVGNRMIRKMWFLLSSRSAALARMASPHLAPTECGLG